MMTKQIAERPITASFKKGSSCTFDSNDFVQFEILTHDLPMGEIVFNGSPFTDAGLTELGRCTFDYCDHGLYIYQELCNRLYEAQHPWLDLRDALEKKCLKVGEDYLTLSILSNGTHDYNIYNCEENILPVVWTVFRDKVESLSMDSYNIVAFKPVNPLDFYHFNQVKVWQPPETVL
jgi:hypothetical protein